MRPSVRFFRETWRELSGQGICDDIDSAEYRRVFQEWRRAERPWGLFYFIEEAANRSVQGWGTMKNQGR